MPLPDLGTCSVTVRNYKCFGDTDQGFESIKPINVIVGRNNSGKSSLLDLIWHAANQQPETAVGARQPGKMPFFTLSRSLSAEGDKEVLKRVFPDSTSGGAIKAASHWEYGKKLLGARFVLELAHQKKYKPLKIVLSDGQDLSADLVPLTKIYEQLANSATAPLAGYRFHRLQADRNVRAETDDGSTSEIQGDTNPAARSSTWTTAPGALRCATAAARPGR